MFLVLMTALLFPLALMAGSVRHSPRSFVAWLLLLEAGCLGSFVALDLILFFLFFELTLVPVYFVIAGWGFAGRAYAAVKFFVYTFLGSAFLLVGIVALALIHQRQTGHLTFDLVALTSTHLGLSSQVLLFLAFTAAFAVKAPVFPFHTWSPDAYAAAPTGGAVILAAVMAKMGTYGLIRFDLTLFPRAVVDLAPLLLTLGVIGILYGAIVACATRDLKRLVAYSSLSHLGFVVLGTFALTTQGLTGGVLQMVNHGLVITVLFIVIGWIYERRGTWQATGLRGLQRPAPILAAVFTVAMLAAVGLPGLNGFVGEFLVLVGTFLSHRWWAVVATAGVVLAAIYLLWAYQQVFHHEPDPETAKVRDLSWREMAVVAPLIALIVFLGVYPKPVLDRITPSVERIVGHVDAVTGKYPAPLRRRRGHPRLPARARRPRRRPSPRGDAMTAPLGMLALAAPKISYLSILPVLVMLGGAVATLGVSSVLRRPMEPTAVTAMTVLTALGSLSFALVQWFDVADHGAHVTIDAAVVEDGFSALVAVLVSSAAVLAALVGDGWMRREGTVGPEFQVLMLVSASGAMVMASANDLIVVFLGLEILSIALYVLAAMNTRRAESGEAALKYFVLGSFSSAVFLYGIALVYGATGTTNLPQIADFLAKNVMLHDGLLLAGMALLLVGFGFKVAAVPFHLWTPDVYQGSPSPITGFMAAVAKAGGFAALLRVFISSFGIERTDWQPAVWVIAAVTLVLGAVVALAQRDIKRMLAYSSINHAGFVLLGLQAATTRGAENGVEGALYYLFVYTFMVIGSFAVVTVVGGPGDTRHGLERYRGLAARRPLLAGSLAVLLMAQAGIPFTTGFLAKLEVISASVGARSTPLAVIAMVSAAIAAFFYLRVILLMYTPGVLDASAEGEAPSGGAGDMDAVAVEGGATTTTAAAAATATSAGITVVERRDVQDGPVPPTVAVAIALCVAVTVVFGVWPAPLVDFAHKATLLFG